MFDYEIRPYDDNEPEAPVMPTGPNPAPAPIATETLEPIAA